MWKSGKVLHLTDATVGTGQVASKIQQLENTYNALRARSSVMAKNVRLEIAVPQGTKFTGGFYVDGLDQIYRVLENGTKELVKIDDVQVRVLYIK